MCFGYIHGASGKISGNQVSNFQKNGIEVHGPASATIEKNVIKGRGPITDIAQNGIVIRDGGSATVKNNTISGFNYTLETNEATGILLWYNELGTFAASANKFAGNEVNIYSTATEGSIDAPGGHVKPLTSNRTTQTGVSARRPRSSCVHGHSRLRGRGYLGGVGSKRAQLSPFSPHATRPSSAAISPHGPRERARNACSAA